MSDTGSGPPNPFSREGSQAADGLGADNSPVPPTQETWPTYPAAAPSPAAPYAAPYADPPIDGAYGSNPYDVHPYPVNPYQVNPYQSSYGGSGPYGAAPTQHPQAVTALVLGILGVVLGFSCAVGGLLGIGGIVLGRRVRREIDAEPGRFTGRGAATAGLVTGILGIVVGVLYAVFFVAMFTLSGTSGDF
jgi:hypothetical protein